MARVVVVTGGSRGIGAATCLTLARQGWDVCLGYRQDEDAAARVAAECEEAGAKAVAVRGEVSEPAALAELFDAAAGLGPVGAVVSNAGIVARHARVDEMEAERVERVLRVNTLGAILCSGEAVRRMSTRHGGAGGAIVHVSSSAARLGSPGEYVDYAAAKAAVDTLTIGLAKEVAREGIRVNAVRPGLIDTEIHASGGAPDRVARLADLVPLGRGGDPQEVADAIAWLASDAASYVTGAILDVSGGR